MFCNSEFAMTAWPWVPNVGLSGLSISKNRTEVLTSRTTCGFLGLAVVLGWLETFGIDCADRKWASWVVVLPSIPTDILILLVGVLSFDGDALTSVSPVGLWDVSVLMRALAGCATAMVRATIPEKLVDSGP